MTKTQRKGAAARGHIERRGDGSWRVEVFLGRDPATGRKRRVRRTVRGSREDAQRALTEILRELDLGRAVEPSQMAAGEYLDRWLEAVAARVRPRSAQRYAEAVRKWIAPELGPLRLQALSPLDLERAQAAWLRAGLSPRTVDLYHTILHRALRDAVGWGLLPANPLDRVPPPRWEAPEMRVLGREEVRALLRAAEGARVGPLVTLALATGLRKGELLALRWQDIEEDGRGGAAVHVRGNLQRVGRGEDGLRIVPPKTKSSVRSVRIGDRALAALRRQRLWCERQRLSWGPAWRGDGWGLVFPREDGKPLSPGWVAWAFGRVAERAGLRPPLPRFHDLRHTFATHQLAAGTPPHVVARILGHADVATTLRIYAHVLPVQQEQAAAVADEIISPVRALPRAE